MLNKILEKKFYYFLLIFLTLIDQLIKLSINHSLSVGERVEIIPDFFYLTHHINKGIAFSFLANIHNAVFYLGIFSFVAALVFLYLIYSMDNKLYLLIMSVMAGGCIGNMIDRLFNQGVTDMFHFYIFSYSFAVFNFADICLSLGTFALFIYFIFNEWHNKDKRA